MAVAARDFKKRAVKAIWEQPDYELQCLLCGNTVAEVFGRRVKHPATCTRELRWVAGRPRCCSCGGPVVLEPSAAIVGAGIPRSRAS
jgi:hypothetical protein